VNLLGGHAAPELRATATKTFVLRDAGKGHLTGTVELRGQKTAVTLTRVKEVLVLYGTYQGGMKVFAQQCSAYYRAKGYVVHELPGDWIAAVSAVAGAEETGHTFTRVVVVSHGGWDGPMFEGQFCQLSG